MVKYDKTRVQMFYYLNKLLYKLLNKLGTEECKWIATISLEWRCLSICRVDSLLQVSLSGN